MPDQNLPDPSTPTVFPNVPDTPTDFPQPPSTPPGQTDTGIPPAPTSASTMPMDQTTPPPPPGPIGTNDFPPVIKSSMPSKGKGKLIATILGIFLLVGAVGAGVILVGQKQLFQQKASDTQSYSTHCDSICNRNEGAGVCKYGGCSYAGGTIDMIHFVCDQITTSGCNDEEIWHDVTSFRGFVYRECGSEQIDSYDGTNGGAASLTYNEDCRTSTPRPTSTPTPTPRPSTTPVPTPPPPGTPMPTVTPTPIPTPFGCNSTNCHPGQVPDGCATGLFCYQWSAYAWACRNASCPTETDCTCDDLPRPTLTPTPTPTRPPGSTPTPTPSPTPTRPPGATPTPTVPPSCPIPPQCIGVKAYDTNWNPLSALQLSALKPGNRVRFTVSAASSPVIQSTDIDKARFTINNLKTGEITTKRPGTEEFYYEYTIPAGVTDFTIGGELHSIIWGWF